MKDNLYNPLPTNPVDDCGCNQKPSCPPVPPAPDFPPFCPEDRPQMGRPPMPPSVPMPPVPSVVSGMDLYEAMNKLSDRVNVCIHNYNAVMAENYKTLHNLQRAAQENGAYYGPGEVWVEEGYNADEGATYHLIHKACVDRRGEPIRMQLHLAYGNTTNSKIEQPMFAASKVEFADKMVVAIPKGDNGWYGKAIWHGCPIASAEEETLWTVGFTQGGVMRVYNNGVTVDQMLRDTVENAMGVSGVLIQNGQICDESYTKYIPQRDEQASRVVMGQVLATREVVILTVGKENEVNRKGLTSATCAQILKQYGCDIAVELCEGSGSGAMDKGSLMYVPDDTTEPSMYAYWFISRKCFYKNDYERELAELVQNYGACLWQGFLNKKAIAKVKEELDEEIERAKAAEEVLQENIDKETERAKAEEQRLDGKIDDETARAKAAEQVLQENIDKETERAKAAEETLQANIDKEVERATSEEQRIEGKVDAEIERATAEEQRLDSKIDAETERAKGEEQRIEGNLNEEITRAKAAEQKLTEEIDAEVHRATNAEAVLHQEVLTEQGERIAADNVLQGNINKEAEARVAGDNQLQSNLDKEVQDRQTAISQVRTELIGKIDALTLRVSECESDIQNLQTLTTTLQQQMASLDATVAGMQETVSNIEKALNEVKQSITSLNTTVNTLVADVQVLTQDMRTVEQNLDNEVQRATNREDELAGLIEAETERAKKAEEGFAEGYVKKSGDTMTGVLTMSDQNIKQVADPVDEGDAVNKKYTDDADNAEAERAKAAENGLDERVTKIESGDIPLDGYAKSADLDAEIERAKAAEQANATAIENETTNRTTVDSQLQASITAEANRAEAAESAIKSSYVKKAGDYMTGNLSMDGHMVTNLKAPTGNNDAANKAYVDEAVKNYPGRILGVTKELTVKFPDDKDYPPVEFNTSIEVTVDVLEDGKTYPCFVSLPVYYASAIGDYWNAVATCTARKVSAGYVLEISGFLYRTAGSADADTCSGVFGFLILY